MLRALVHGWIDPRDQMQRFLAAPKSEARVLSWLYLACVIGFLAGLPGIGGQVAGLTAQGVPEAMVVVVTGRLLGALFFAPLAFYGLAAVAHLASRALGGGGDWYGARVALFWSMLMLSPLLLVMGIVPRVVEPEIALGPFNALASLGFLWVWAHNFGIASGFSKVWPVYLIMIISLIGLLMLLRGVALLAAV